MPTTFKYTRNMKSLFEERMAKLKSFYCRDDLEQALQAYDRAPADAKKSRERDLKDLCKATDIDMTKLIADRSILDTLPTRGEIKETLLQSFYDLYAAAPTTTAVMERIVRRLAPEYKKDTVRTAILKKFVLGAGDNFKRYNTKSVEEWAKERFTEKEKKTFSSLNKKEQMALIVSKLDDSIFKREEVTRPAGDVLCLMADCIEKYKNDENLSFAGLDLSSKTEEMLNAFMGKAGLSPEKLSADDKLKKIAEALKAGTLAEDCLGSVSELEKAVEKELKEQLKAIPVVKKTGKPGTAADRYGQAKKDAAKARKAAATTTKLDADLLNLCSDLAKGNFRVNGKTKVQLYYFAFMFGMTLSLPGKECEEERDIVKNLFQDYYNDNLLRFLAGDYADPKKATSVETEPTGEGINYKNYAEAIYLYFLCRDDLEMTPGERIDKAEELIGLCARTGKTTDQSDKGKTKEYTKVYRDKHFKGLLENNPADVVEYVCREYIITNRDNPHAARIMVDSGENTASDSIAAIREDLDAESVGGEPFDMIDENAVTDEIKEDIKFSADAGFRWNLRDLLQERYGGDENFMKVVNILDNRTRSRRAGFDKADRERMLMVLHVLAMHSGENNSLSMYKLRDRLEKKRFLVSETQVTRSVKTLGKLGYDIKRDKDNYYLDCRQYKDAELNDLLRRVSGRYFECGREAEQALADIIVSRQSEDRRVTRSELIALHFQCYLVLLEGTVSLDTFTDVLEDYLDTIDPILERARYQPINFKNIFDMYIVISLYLYLTENGSLM